MQHRKCGYALMALQLMMVHIIDYMHKNVIRPANIYRVTSLKYVRMFYMMRYDATRFAHVSNDHINMFVLYKASTSIDKHALYCT